jgi:hypothetical protein
MRHNKLMRLRPSPALVVAFIALFAAMGGLGYAATKLKPNSVKTKTIRNGAVTSGKLADGSVTTAKLSPDAVAPNAVNAMDAAKLGGAAPGQCQLGWLKASTVVDTSTLTPEQPDAVVPAFDCASRAADAVTIHRTDVGRYTLTLAGIDSGVAISSSTGANAVTAASEIDHGQVAVRVWNNGDAAFVDGKTFSLIAF